MLTVVAPLFDANRHSFHFSRCYDETWVEKLYRGFARNLTRPFRFVCFTERERTFSEPIGQERFSMPHPSYAAGIEIYRIEGPMIIVGLDTVIVGNIDHLADWCEASDVLGLPRDPYRPAIACNGVALVPPGKTHIAEQRTGEVDMVWLRRYPHAFIDDLWPGQVLSYKVHMRDRGLTEPPADARIVYFHGKPKQPDLADADWIGEHWR